MKQTMVNILLLIYTHLIWVLLQLSTCLRQFH